MKRGLFVSSEGFNSRLREEATGPFLRSYPLVICFNSRLREEATVVPLFLIDTRMFQLTPP